MPIVVQHQPDAALLARAGYQEGAGQFMQWAEEMAQRERMQIRAQEYDMVQRRMDQQADLYRANLVSADRAMQMQTQIERDKLGGELELRKAELEREDRFDRLQLQHKNQMAAKQAEFANTAELDQNQFLFKRADTWLNDITSLQEDGYQFTPDELRQVEAAKKDISRIMGEDSMTPTAKAQAVFKITEGLPIPKNRQRTVPEVLKEEVVEREVTLPDGTKGIALLSLDRDGHPRAIATFEQKPQKESATGTIQQQVMASPELFLKYRAQAYKEVTKYDLNKNPIPPSEEEVDKRIQEIIANAPQATPQQQQPAQQAAPQQSAPTPQPVPVQQSSIERAYRGAPVLRYNPATGQYENAG